MLRVGFDWLTRNVLTLRHAAGADRYSSVDTLNLIRKGVARKPPVEYLPGSATAATSAMISRRSAILGGGAVQTLVRTLAAEFCRMQTPEMIELTVLSLSMMLIQ